MSTMYKELIKAQDASFGLSDSKLEKLSDRVEFRNVECTLSLRLFLRFVDPKSSSTRIVHKRGGDYFQDADNWLFPLKPWTTVATKAFSDGVWKAGQSFWDGVFFLKTPDEYTELDSAWNINGKVLRPNIVCRFDLKLVSQANSHFTVEVFNIDFASGDHVSNIDGREAQMKEGRTPDNRLVRSEGGSYDSFDLTKPELGVFHDKACRCTVQVKTNMIAHELGHLLGQLHIGGLRGVRDCTATLENIKKKTLGLDKCYEGPQPLDHWNVMGGGDQLDVVNAISWQKRMEEHTGIRWDRWTASKGWLDPRLITK